MKALGFEENPTLVTDEQFDDLDVRNLIGTPVANTVVYVLDKFKRPVPKGTVGELYLGGVQISRGYIKQPELTAERFIPNPFQTKKQKTEGWNDRLYQTGDLVRMLPDGTLEYHGRNDFQVKIRGYRIELGEIEEALLHIPKITQASVTVLGEERNQYLGAYYVSEAEISQDALDQELSRYLPDYMIPSVYHYMTEFPLTVNGKLDRRALPNINFNSTAEYMEPTTPMEIIVAECYSEVLEVSLIGTQDDFFQLGGHSLRALKLINLLEARTQKAVQVRHIFEFSKVFQLAEIMEKQPDLTAYERIPKAEEKSVYDMSPSQRRLYTFWKYVENSNGIGNNMPMLLKFKERLDEKQVQEVFEKLITRHEIYRTTFAEREGRFIQIIHDEMAVDIQVEHIKESDVNAWFDQVVRSLDLEAGPLYNIKIARTESHDHLFIDIHHIISDGRSHTNLTTELSLLFIGMELPPLDRQYRDYSEWLRTKDLSESEKYWLESMENYPVLKLPTDYPRPLKQDFAGGKERMVLDKETTDHVKEFLKKAGATEYMFYLALISILLSKHAGQNDLVIGSPMSGRIHRDLDDMLGMLVNSLPMRVAPKNEKSFISYLEELRIQTLSAYDHQIYPLDILRDKLIKTEDLSRHPLYDVLYVYQNNELIDPELLGLEDWKEYEIPEKLDLNYTLSNNGKETFIELTYATQLFKAETIQGYQASLKKLIEQVLVDAKLTIQELNV